MKTTYSDMIANLDNLNYVGRCNRPVKRINSKYEVVLPNSFEHVVHTEYSNNEAMALKTCRYRFSIYCRKIERLAIDCFEEFDRIRGAYIRKTDRDGNISKIDL